MKRPARSLNKRGCKRLLDQLSASAPRYASLGLVRTNGDLLASASPASRSSSQAPDLALNQSRCPAWLDRIFQNRAFTIGQMATGVGGRPAIVLGFPVFGREGQLQGAAFALLAWPWLTGAGSELPAQLPRGAAWTELAVDGAVLARLPEPEDAPAASFAESSFAKIPFTGQNGLVEALDSSGVPAIFAFAHGRSQLTRGDVLSVLSIPRNVLFAEADRMVTRNLTWLAAAAGLALALGLLGGHFLIVRPLKALAFFSARLAAGDLVARNGLSHSRDELGQLSRALAVCRT